MLYDESDAFFSDDMRCRYELYRSWGNGRTVNFVMLNPSTAGVINDDATIRKCVGFANRWGFHRLIVTNLIPYISTDPWKLPAWRSNKYLVDNTRVLKSNLRSDLVVVAWGSLPYPLARTISFAEYLHRFMELTSEARIRLMCIGTTAKGAPKHPSRAPYTNHPILFSVGL